jgi:diguanylate cyclase (GGDEF)-like protein
VQIETIERLRADLVEVASRDPLTGLHNRRHLVERFGPMVEAAERDGGTLSVALLDVDRFKVINDQNGHLAGDQVLIAFAERMLEHAPADAVVCRVGEEFFFALPGADAATGLAFADGLRRRCEQEGIEVDGRTIHCTLSGGVATYPASGSTTAELFHAADLSMCEAKKDGRNVIRHHRDRARATQVDTGVR